VFEVIPSAEAVTSLLIFKPDEIGDAVYALPAVAELRRAFPKARVYLLCQRLTRPLYERTQLFDEIVDIAPGTRLTRPVFSVQEALGRFSVEAFDMSVFLRTYPAYFRQFRSIPAKLQVHPVDPHMRSDSVHRAHVGLWEDERVHQSLQLLQIVARVTGKAYSWDHVRFPEFEWSREDRLAEERTFGGNGPDRFVVVHPFVKHETRQYPLAYWVVLIERLRRAVDAQWVIVGGPDDPRIEGLPDVIQTQGELSLSQTGYLLSRAAGFIGVLSGPAHWAAALGTPTVTIMSGHSLPIEWAPLGQSLVIRAEVPCAPCHQKTCPVYGLACLTELTPERIAPSIEDFLANATRQSVRLGSA
jgi:ADP-heptose:LPS heptosyltransferase